jgi:mannan endo-1,6-alpha-mannosidase
MKAFVLASLVGAAVNIDLQQESQVKDAIVEMAKNLLSYYDPPNTAANGSIYPNRSSGPDGFQWYESGIMWGILMQAIRVTGDVSEIDVNIIVNALTEASYFKTGSFLGELASFDQVILGKWNDDIGWWAMATSTGGELFGADTLMPGGVSYQELTDTTYKQIMAQWSESCGGGIYWSRDRNNAQTKGYKSTITNSQAIMLAARLSILKNDSSYLDQGNMIYTWLKESGIVRPDYSVLDGIDEDRSCGIVNEELSYKSGMTAGALAWMYKASGNPYYIEEANKITQYALTKFTQSDIFADACEPSCEENKVSPKGTMLRGLGFVAEFTNNAALKARLTRVLENSVAAMLKTCNSEFGCGNYWVQGKEQTNVHYQINALELMTSYYKAISKNFANNLTSPSRAPSESGRPKVSSGGYNKPYALYAILTFVLLSQ